MSNLHALATELDSRYPDTARRSERVALYSAAIAVRLGLDDDRVEGLIIAGKLHDVGKSVVPDEILCRAGPLTAEEMEIVRRHPEEGQRIVAQAGLGEIAVWIRHHHERWDGQGYPDHFTGPQIPLESRVLGAADALEAMTSARPYKDALTATMAAVEVEASGGTQFDPGVARVVAELLRRRAIRPGWDGVSPIAVDGTDDGPRRLGLAEYIGVQAALIANGHVTGLSES